MSHQLASFVAGSALLLGTPAGAGIMNFQGTLEISFGSATVSWNTVSVATVNSGGPGGTVTRLQIPSGAFFGTRTGSFTGSTPTLSGLSATALRVSLAGNGAADWIRTPMAINVGKLPLPGSLRLCLLGGCAVPMDVDLDVAAAASLGTQEGVSLETSMGAPLGLALPFQLALQTGVGTMTIPTTQPPFATIGKAHIPLLSVDVTIHTVKRKHQPMSTSTITIMAAGGAISRSLTGSFPGGFAHGPLSNTGSEALTGGVIQMVRPFAIVGANSGGDFGTVRTTIKFIPEPVMAVSFACGAMLLVWLGARRKR